MTSQGYHEPVELLSEDTRNRHRAIITLIEELEAIDWYTQRADACTDDELRAVIVHNRDEELEHAMMTLEWLRRKFPELDREARSYLFTDKPIVGAEQGRDDGGRDRSLRIGSLRRDSAEETD